jgi:uncharacterized membrane protein
MSIRKRTHEAVHRSRKQLLEWLRNSFFTGIVVAAPIGITVWLVWSFISFVDDRIKPLIPHSWNPETYLKFALPGLGIVVGVAVITLLGALTANFVGKAVVHQGERVLNRLPVIRSIYSALKQMVTALTPGEAASFKGVVLVEFPSEGRWAVAFVTNQSPGGEISARIPNAIAVFVPGTPNPAMGNLFYIPAEKAIPMNITVEEAAKLVVSGGIASLDASARAPERIS